MNLLWQCAEGNVQVGGVWCGLHRGVLGCVRMAESVSHAAGSAGAVWAIA
jgi:hypothetical protein